MEPSGFRRLLLASYNITPQGGRDNVAEDHFHVQMEIKAPFVSSKDASHTLSTVSLDCNGSNASSNRHMPESPYIFRAIAITTSIPTRLQHRGTNDVHISLSRRERNVSPSTSAGTRIHPPLREATGISAASLAAGRHLQLLPKIRKSAFVSYTGRAEELTNQGKDVRMTKDLRNLSLKGIQVKTLSSQ